MEKETTFFKATMQMDNVSNLSTDEALKTTGQLIDMSLNLLNPQGLEKAFSFLEDIQVRSLDSTQKATLHYFWGNAWSNISFITQTNAALTWNREQNELEQEIFHLRKALQVVDNHQELPKQLLCKILTNLGNLLSHVGRFVDAIEYWNRALALLPDFSMAQGNRGLGLCHYADAIYQHHNIHDAIKFARHAKHDLEDALNSQTTQPDVRSTFERYLQWAAKNVSDKHVFTHSDSFGETDEETKYRRWTAKKHLFLNYLNDIQTNADVAQDNLMLSSIVQPIEEGPHYHGLFNQIKQEFVSARYLYYEGIMSEHIHFSDKSVQLYNTGDYPSYSLAVEKIKISFKVAYSIFDKIAFFLNSYFKLGIKERQVNFRTCWYQKQSKDKGLRKEFTHQQNLPLLGLFWLSKDLFENRNDFLNTIDPDAQKLSIIRNHLEHKYLKIHEFGAPKKGPTLSYSYDNLAYSIGRSELAGKTIRTLKLARAALIYLSLSVSYEETIKSNSRNSEKILNMEMPLFEEEWKF